uniref:Uncharacterized protein n=1 Tax=Arundo donax TaxID=35708 RepID=A0A0A9E5Z3_ARUDO
MEVMLLVNFSNQTCFHQSFKRMI